MLEARNISLNIEGTQLLQDINLTCENGSVTSIMGPNGAGKTSLLRVLTDEYRNYAGQVWVNGRQTRDWNTSERARMVSVLPQHSSLDFPFTVEEVVNLGRTPHDTGANRDREIVKEVLSKVDASYLAKRSYPNLSGGEKQRVQLARVLAQIWEAPTIEGQSQNRLLLLDEPSSAFDLAHQQLLKEIVREVAARGVTVVMVVHDFNLGVSVSDQMIILSCGCIKAAGKPAEILKPALIESVFGVPVEVISHPGTGEPLIVA